MIKREHQKVTDLYCVRWFRAEVITLEKDQQHLIKEAFEALY